MAMMMILGVEWGRKEKTFVTNGLQGNPGQNLFQTFKIFISHIIMTIQT